ncbi:MAG TPA: PDZ domain-containing protein, partial [Candidatus Limnocylindrales bacterium]
ADGAFRSRVEALGQGESPSRPRLGIAVAPAHVARRLRQATGLPQRDGVLVREVESDSPAERAGIAQGDLVVAVAGQPTPDVDELHIALGAAKFPFEVSLVRGTEERTVTVEEAAPSEG